MYEIILIYNFNYHFNFCWSLFQIILNKIQLEITAWNLECFKYLSFIPNLLAP